ncbi:hypothetical protein ABKV19_004514, partial [Rosa sericea]
ENQIFKLGHVIESVKVVVAGVSWQVTEGNVQVALLEGNQCLENDSDQRMSIHPKDWNEAISN